jgi:hypothetical protein
MLWGPLLSKGPAPVNPPDVGDHTTVTRTSRRALLGAGAVGAAMALLLDRTVAASAGLPTADRDLLGFAMALELTARDLYDEAIAAGADPTLLAPMADQHRAYGEVLAGVTGLSANVRVDELFEANAPAFATSDTAAAAEAAYELESVAVATHLELLGLLTDISASKTIASIMAMEARHCTVLAHATGRGDDLDAMLTNSADPITPEVLS